MKKAVILVNPHVDRDHELYQPLRIREELALLGVSAEICPNAWSGKLISGQLTSDFSHYDFAVYLDKDKYLPRILEKEGMRLFNRAQAVELCDDKALTHIALAGKVAMPNTCFAPLCYKKEARPISAKQIAKQLGLPIVVKECFGSLGVQVYLANDLKELSALRRKLKLRPHLLQEFIKESAGQDVRVITVGGKAVAAMKRSSDCDFRSNIGLGGRGEPYPLGDSERKIARTVSDALGLDYCGIDLLLGKDGYLVCEVNSNAFFSEIERVTGINVAGAYARHIYREIYGET